MGRIQAERERLELRRLKEAHRELEAKAQRRTQAELARMRTEGNRLAQEQGDREAAKRRARADTEAQAEQERRRREEERRRQEAHEQRVRTGKRLAEKAVEAVPGLDLWDRLEIQRAATAALEKASDTEPIDTIVDRTISLQVRLLKPPKPIEPVHTPAAPESPPAEAAEPDDTDPDDDPDDIDEEPCDDPDCEDCNPSNARGSGWGFVLLLGGIATLAVAKHVADKRTATPSGETPAAS